MVVREPVKRWVRRHSKAISREPYDEAVRAAFPSSYRSMLDIGSGTKRYPRATTVDVNPAHAPSVVADGQGLPFRHETFDFVLMEHVLHDFPDPALALEEARRILAPGGLILATAPHLFPTISDWDRWRFTEPGLRQLFREFDLVGIKPVSVGWGAVALLLARLTWGRARLLTTVIAVVVNMVRPFLERLAPSRPGVAGGYVVEARKPLHG